MKTINALESGIPNSAGVVLSPSITDSELNLTTADFTAIAGATTVVAEVTMDTYNNGGTPVKLRTDANFKVGLGLEAKVNFIREL